MLGTNFQFQNVLPKAVYLGAALIGTLGGLSSGEVLAANCDTRGGLAYLGNVKGSTRSVWLSGTSAGSFNLEAAQGNQVVDSWSKAKRGLHLSLSPVVSNGNGGTHKLYGVSNGKPCLLDTQNQIRGLFPDNILPHGLPDVGPQRIFPDFSLPDGRPDVGPQPVFPNFSPPDGRPDVGPQPVFPDFSPPDGRPDVGPQPVFPDFSPPDGRPDVGPQPVFPRYSPPTRETHRRSRTPVGRNPPNCIDPRSVDRNQTNDQPICPNLEVERAAEQAARQTSQADQSQVLQSQVPLTPGRDLGAPAPWNFWSSFRFADISDDRYERESDSVARSVDMGLDRRITDDLIIGMTFSLEDSATDSFGGSLDIQTAGFRLGPYAAYRLSPHWAIDTLLTYGHYYNDVDLSVLTGDYNSERFSGEVTLHGQYRFGAFFVRPKASVSYSYVYSDDYDLAGRILNLPVSVSVDGATANYGALDFSTEVSRNFNLPDGQPFRVFAELGAQYEFERPDDGKILSGDLTEVIPSPWEFSVRSGFRTLLNEAIQIEATGGYLSLGQEDLDVWEGKFHLSWSF